MASSPVFAFDEHSPLKVHITPFPRPQNLLLLLHTPHFGSLTKIRDELSHEWAEVLKRPVLKRPVLKCYV